MIELVGRTPRKELVTESLESLPEGGGLISLAVGAEYLIPAQKEIIETFYNYEIPGLFLCMDKPWSTTVHLLNRKNTHLYHVNFLDCILPTQGKFARYASNLPHRVSCLGRPYDLKAVLKRSYAILNDITTSLSPFVSESEDLTIIPNEALTSDTVFLIVDNICSLEGIHEPETISRFVRFLRSILDRMAAAYGVVLMAGAKARPAIQRGVEAECTKNLRIKEWLG